MHSHNLAPRLRHAWWPLIVALAALLGACGGGGSSGTDNPQPSALVLNEDSAAGALYQVQTSGALLPPHVDQLITLIGWSTGCENEDGHLEKETDQDGRIKAARFDSCKLREGIFIDTDSTLDGTVHYEYIGDEQTYPLRMTLDHMSKETRYGSGEDRTTETIVLDGSLIYTAPKVEFFGSISEANGTAHFFGGPGDKGLARDYDVHWRYQDYGASVENISGMILLSTEGRITLDPDTEHYVDIIPGDQLMGSPPYCLELGSFALEGGNGTSVSVTFNGTNGIVVTLNGNAEPVRSCNEYRAWLQESGLSLPRVL